MGWIKKIKDFFVQDFQIANESNHKVSLAVAVGCMCAVLPIWGFQMIAAFAIAGFLRLNKIVVVATSNISIPPITPVWLYLSYVIGCFLFGRENSLSFNGITLEEVSKSLIVYVVGAIVLAILLGVASYFLCYGLLAIFRKKQPNKIDQDGQRENA